MNEGLNKELFIQIRDQIKKEPQNFNMSDFGCGSVHCIGGWALEFFYRERDLRPEGRSLTALASKAFGFSREIGRRLFYGDWPKGYNSSTDDVSLVDIKAEDTIKLLDDLINDKLDINEFND